MSSPTRSRDSIGAALIGLLFLLAANTAAFGAASQVAPMYALDFVGTAATGFDLNDAGDVLGEHYTDPGCGPFCLPPQKTVVWRGGVPIELPLVPGYDSSSQFPLFINNQGLIAGEVVSTSGVHAAVWTPNGAGYVPLDLFVLSGMSSVDVRGLDDTGRIIGWASTGGAFPSAAAPFMWSAASGWLNLNNLGYPNEIPAAISPGGKVVTTNSWYQLGEPASATLLPPLPGSFVGAGSNGSAINDAGDQAHFLVSTSTQNLVYPFRLSNGGTWQQISSFGTGHLSRYGMGSINAAQDVTFTAGSTGLVAAGPDGLGQSLAARISPAYPGATVGLGGPMNASGQILAQVMIGRSQRLMKMTPVTACGTDCLVVSSLSMTGQFVQDPSLPPGYCTQDGKMYNVSTATAIVTSETGAALANVQVSGRFLDDYWTNRPVTGTTNASGAVSWTHQGSCGVGAIAFLVENASLGTRSFDRTRGTLTSYVIPGTTPPPPTPIDVAIASQTVIASASGSDRIRGIASVRVVQTGTSGGVGGVTVSGQWSGDYTGSGSGLTDSNGDVTIQTPNLRGASSFTFCVNSLTGTGINDRTGLNDCANSGGSPPPPPLANAPDNLSVSWKTKGQVRADLSWTGGGSIVDIYENGTKAATISNVNGFRDNTPGLSYKVCNEGKLDQCTSLVAKP